MPWLRRKLIITYLLGQTTKAGLKAAVLFDGFNTVFARRGPISGSRREKWLNSSM
jgi:hypothetical protein